MLADAPLGDGLVTGRRRVILVTAAVAVASLALGMAVGSRVTSPREAAARARPPEASTITAPVELRQVRSEVVTRGDVVYEGAADVSIALEGLATSPVVTGQIPRVGDTVEAGTVVLQLVARPVIVLPGEMPASRTLSPGSTGADVAQLEAALAALALDPGAPVDDVYDQRTAAAVAQLYERVGYAAPTPDETLVDELKAAREDLAAAEERALAANRELSAAAQGPSESERLDAEAGVAEAQRMLAEAEAAGDAATIATARSQLAIVEAQRDELLAARNTTFEEAAVVQAETKVAGASRAVSDLASRVGTPLPASEVVFLLSLPRRVDAVHVVRGTTVNGPVMTVTGTDLVVLASLGRADAELVKADTGAHVDIGDGMVKATVAQVRQAGVPSPGDAGGGAAQPSQQGQTNRRFEAVVRPGSLTPEQTEMIRGQNVRVVIPVQATDGEVLAVPLAALTTGPDGETRLEVERSTGIERVVVEVGLAAGGFAEVRPRGASLEAGDRVVVGR